MANFCTLNPLAQYDITLSEGNLKATPGSSGGARFYGTHYMTSGKWYCEFLVTLRSNYHHYGIHAYGDRGYAIAEDANNGRVIVRDDGPVYIDGGQSTTVSSFTTGDVIGIAVDMDNGKLYFYKNNTNISGSGHNITGYQTRAYTFHGLYNANAGSTRCNFGQFPWRYDPPSGFVALSTENLSEPPISNLAAEKPEDYFNTVLYTGTGASVQIPVGFQPDLIWGKKRSAPAQNNWLIDSVRGAGVWLSSDGSGVEGSEPAGSSFTSTGFTTNNNSLFTYNTGTYVAWCWKAGGTAVSNTNGSLTTQVSANTDAGFSIITYTGAGSGVSTIGHGLSQAPEFWVTKPRTTVSDDQWFCCHVGIASDYYNYWLHWDNNSAAQNSGARWGGVAPTDTLLSIGSNSTNKSGDYVCYAWHSVEGFSKFGSYTGNGNNDGPFVFTGFRPAYVMIKETSGTGSWLIVDTARDPYNVSLTGNHLAADSSNAEQTAASRSPTFGIDYLSNGFKLRGSHDENNESGQNYVYMAFAESPYKYSSAR